MTTKKSATDQFWNQRALQESDPVKVNIADDVQRQLETEFIVRHLRAGSRLLEVGAGNGHLTATLRQHVGFVDAFDYAENMVQQAIALQGQTNNRFFHDSVLDPKSATPGYEAIVCVRVLINLANEDQQVTAFRNMTGLLKPGGELILIEGFSDGFDELNRLRAAAGMEPLKPAAINFYSPLANWLPRFDQAFNTTATFNTGCFDFLTRVVYPALVGTSNANGPGEFHQHILPVARAFNNDGLLPFARLRGFVLKRK